MAFLFKDYLHSNTSSFGKSGGKKQTRSVSTVSADHTRPVSSCHTHTHACTHTHAPTHACTHTHAHTHTHMHTHTHAPTHCTHTLHPHTAHTHCTHTHQYLFNPSSTMPCVTLTLLVPSRVSRMQWCLHHLTVVWSSCLPITLLQS